jgi:uncharacterized protein (TIGR02145 family)
MRKYYFTITLILVLVIGITSCSNEETKTQNETASRPTIPIMVNEVQIGNQIWMSKNLNVSRYRNGDPIPEVTDPVQWRYLTSGAWCYYNNNPAYGKIYGKLYNWYAVNDPRGLAPTNWHIPSDAEFTILADFLGGVAIAGGKMKTTILWDIPNTGATNSSGFAGIPGGCRYYDGSGFSPVNRDDYMWTSTPTSIDAIFHALSFGHTKLERYPGFRTVGFSVRCIKD